MGILTGHQIRKDVESGAILVDPYDEELVGTNSLDMRLHPLLKLYNHGAVMHRLYTAWYEEMLEAMTAGVEYEDYLKAHPFPTWETVTSVGPPPILDMLDENRTVDVGIPKQGLILWPGILYLGRTVETVGSKSYVPWFDGRSSVGRLGIHVHVTAGKGDTGWFGTVTLEMHVVHPVRVYADVKPICQASFFGTLGELEEYKGRYQNQVEPTPSRFFDNRYDRL